MPYKNIPSITPLIEEINFENVVFTYSTSNEKILKSINLEIPGKKMTALQFYQYMLQVRDRDTHFNSIMRSRRLCQEYMLTSFHRIERQNLLWLERNQKSIKAEKYKSLRK